MKELLLYIFATALVIFIVIPVLFISIKWSIETFGIYGFGVWLSIVIGGGAWALNKTTPTD